MTGGYECGRIQIFISFKQKHITGLWILCGITYFSQYTQKLLMVYANQNLCVLLAEGERDILQFVFSEGLPREQDVSIIQNSADVFHQKRQAQGDKSASLIHKQGTQSKTSQTAPFVPSNLFFPQQPAKHNADLFLNKLTGNFAWMF